MRDCMLLGETKWNWVLFGKIWRHLERSVEVYRGWYRLGVGEVGLGSEYTNLREESNFNIIVHCLGSEVLLNSLFYLNYFLSLFPMVKLSIGKIMLIQWIKCFSILFLQFMWLKRLIGTEGVDGNEAPKEYKMRYFVSCWMICNIYRKLSLHDKEIISELCIWLKAGDLNNIS